MADQGPFSEYLTAPLQPTQQSMTPPIGGGPATGAAYIAMQFLNGLKQNRLQKYAMQEQQRDRDLQAYNVALNTLEKSNLRDDLKEAYRGRLMQGIAGTIAGDKEATSKNTGNPMTDVIKHVATQFIGGEIPKGTNPLDMNVIAQLHTDLQDKNKSADAHIDEVTGSLMNRINQFKKEAQASGVPLDREAVTSSPEFLHALNTYQAYGRPVQGLEYVLNQLPDRNSAALESIGGSLTPGSPVSNDEVFGSARTPFTPLQQQVAIKSFGKPTEGTLVDPQGVATPIRKWNNGRVETLDGREVYVQNAVNQGYHFAGANGPTGRPVGGSPLSISDAKQLAANGSQFTDAEGKPIDVAGMPPGTALKPFVLNGRTFYVPFSQSQSFVTLNNQRYAVGQFEKKDINTATARPLGTANVGSTSTNQQFAIGPNGEPVVNTFVSTRTPNVVGAAPPSTGRQATSAPPQAGTMPSTTQVPSQAQRQQSNIKGLPPGTNNQMLQRVTAVREANTQIFGDPTQPDVKGLKDYSHLADNPASRERLGTALKLTFDGLDQTIKSSGDLLGIAKNYLNIPREFARSQAALMQEVMQSLTPEEREAYNATMSAFSTITGLRSLTKASAAQFSVKAIERELPVIGVNVADSEQMNNQLGRLAEIVYNGTRGVPSSMFDAKELEAIKAMPSSFRKSSAPPSSGKSKSNSGWKPVRY